MSPKNDHKIQNASSDKNGGKRCKCVGVQGRELSSVTSHFKPFCSLFIFYFSLLNLFATP